jgi:hypothetical protein
MTLLAALSMVTRHIGLGATVSTSFSEPFHVARAAPLHAGVAREAVTLLVDGVEQVIEVVREPRHLGGTQAYWLCPQCEARRDHLYWHQGALLCRACHKLDYRSRHVPAVVARAAKLRRKLGAAPGLLSALPPRPRNVWAAARYDRLARGLAVAESVIAAMLGATIRALERRKGRLHGPR